MRGDEEVRKAIALVGLSFHGEMRERIWRDFPEEAGRAWAMLHALGWVAGVADTDLELTMEYIQLKLVEYGLDLEKEENHHAAD